MPPHQRHIPALTPGKGLSLVHQQGFHEDRSMDIEVIHGADALEDGAIRNTRGTDAGRQAGSRGDNHYHLQSLAHPGGP